jgi:hypothetical protein
MRLPETSGGLPLYLICEPFKATSENYKKLQKGNELRVTCSLYTKRTPRMDKGKILFVRQKDILPIKKQTRPFPYYITLIYTNHAIQRFGKNKKK